MIFKPTRNLLACCICFLLSVSISAQDTIPFHKGVRKGVLPNGLHYYIMPNNYPEGYTDVFLAVNAGAILETDSQQGIAHFVEHMLFNGTKSFPANEIDHFLRKIGLELGPDLNAYTTWDETVYMLRGVPDSLTEKALWILSEMAFMATFDSAEIEKERGVVHNEWRLWSGVQQRVFSKILQELFKGSKYADRTVIGEESIILNAPHDTIISFYKKWYRPDLMAVIVVGNVNPDSAEQWIKKYFGSVKRESPLHRPYYYLPPFERFRVVTIVDSEWAFPSLSIGFIHDVDTPQTIEDWKKKLMTQIISNIFDERYSDIERQENPPFADAYFSVYNMVRTSTFVEWNASISLKNVKRATQELWSEAVRAYRYGFTEGEVERAKKRLLRSLKKKYAERNKTENSTWAFALVDHYLEGKPFPDPEWEYHIAQKILPDISPEDLHNHLKSLWRNDTNRYILLIVNDKELKKAKLPTHKQLIKWIKKAEKRKLRPPEDKPLPRLAHPPTSTPPLPQLKLIDSTLNIWHATLSNGARIWLKPTDFKDDEIRWLAFSPGGLSSLDSSDVIAGWSISEVIPESGLGDVDASTLEKILAGYHVNWSVSLDLLYENIRFTTSPEDLTTALQLQYLLFTQPRQDEKAFKSWRRRILIQLSMLKAFPIIYFLIEGMKKVYGNNPWMISVPEKHQLKSLSWQKPYEIYYQKFVNKVGDFDFVFVGTFEPESLLVEVNKWLGSIPYKRSEADHWVDRKVFPVLCDTTIEFYKGSGKKAFSIVVFHRKWDSWSFEERLLSKFLEKLIDFTVMDSIREESSQIYSAQVNISLEKYPTPYLTFLIFYPSAPEDVESIQNKIHEILNSLAQGNLDTTYIHEVKKVLLNDLKENKQNNFWWRRQIAWALQNDVPLSELAHYEDIIKEVTEQDLQKFANKILTHSCSFRISLFPSSAKEK